MSLSVREMVMLKLLINFGPEEEENYAEDDCHDMEAIDLGPGEKY